MKRKAWQHTGTTTERGLGWAWQKQRLRVLKRDTYLCQDCLKRGRVTPATEVHHMIPRAKAGPSPAKDEDCRSLCSPCHLRRDTEAQGHRPRVEFDAAGRVIW